VKKSYTVEPDFFDEKCPTLTDYNTSEVHWEPGMNLCQTEFKTRKRSKKSNSSETITYMRPNQSFFHYFTIPIHIEKDDIKADNGDGMNGFKLSVREDYEIGSLFRTQMIPNAIDWYYHSNDEDNEVGEVDGEE
jgi:hypothetical protein